MLHNLLNSTVRQQLQAFILRLVSGAGYIFTKVWSFHFILLLKMPCKMMAHRLFLQDESFFLRYHSAVERIQVERFRETALCHRLPLALAAYKMAYFAAFSLKLDAYLNRVVAYDAFYQLIPNRMMNVISAFFALMLLYLQWQYYFVSNRPMNGLLFDVLRGGGPRSTCFFIWDRHQGRDLRDYFCRFFLLIVNCAQAFVLNNCKKFISLCLPFFSFSLSFSISISTPSGSRLVRHRNSLPDGGQLCTGQLYFYFHLLRGR